MDSAHAKVLLEPSCSRWEQVTVLCPVKIQMAQSRLPHGLQVFSGLPDLSAHKNCEAAPTHFSIFRSSTGLPCHTSPELQGLAALCYS